MSIINVVLKQQNNIIEINTS